MRPIAVIDMDIRSPESTHRAHRLDCYDLAGAELSRYAGLVVPPSVDQEHLFRHRDLIRGYLDAGGVVVFGGHLHRDWLPGASTFVPLSPPSLGAYRVADVADHPVFAGVEPDDLTFRRGVAGFFARGHHPPPESAEILVRLAGGEPVTYVDRSSTAGTILVQTTCDLLGYGGGAGGTAGRRTGSATGCSPGCGRSPGSGPTPPSVTTPRRRPTSRGSPLVGSPPSTAGPPPTNAPSPPPSTRAT